MAGPDGAGQQLTLNWMVYVPPPGQRPLRVLLPSGADSVQFVALSVLSVKFEEDRLKLGVCLASVVVHTQMCIHTADNDDDFHLMY